MIVSKKGVHATLILSIVTVILLGGVVFAFADQCISFFSQDSEVIQAGATCIKVMCPFYFALCLHQVYSEYCELQGRAQMPMVTSIMAFVVIRQIFLAIVLQLNHNIAVVGWGYNDPDWILAASFTAFYYFTSHWLKVEESRDAL